MAQNTGLSPSGIMAYKVGGRTIKEYISMIKMPLMALIGLSVLGFILGLLTYIPGVGGVFALIMLPINLLIGVVSLLIACYIGYIVVKNYKGDLATAAYTGAVAGVILGLVSAVISILNSFLTLIISPVLGIASLILSVVGIIIFPIIGAIVMAILAIIGGVVAGSSSFGSASKK
jgi:hypothetical protein